MNDTMKNRMYRTIAMTLPFAAKQDSNNKNLPVVKASASKFELLLPDSVRTQVYDLALSTAHNLKFTVETSGTEIENRKQEIKYHKIEWHRKFSLSMACFVLFFIGAPLGSIIRKGGLGMPLVVAIIFFLLFHLLNMFGEKFVKESILPAYIGMWLAVLVLTPVGIFFTYKAMHDSQLFNKEFYYRIFKSAKNIFSRSKGSATA
jgi:lipopolysaccharide export system permease protein